MANNQLLASDNFASGSLAAGWTALQTISLSQVVLGTPNVAECPAQATAGGQYWTGTAFPNDQVSEVTVHSLANVAGNTIGLLARTQPGAQINCYIALFNSDGTHNTLAVFKVVNGSDIVLGSSVSGLTVAAGDILAFQVAGSALSVYQNGTRIYHYYDTTFTGGSPGFDQISSSGTSGSQIASWRGYSAVQQDGIWQKQGIVIAAELVDLDQTTAGIGIQIGTVIQDGGLFKTWIISDWSNDPAGSMYYAYSSDGINWTRTASAVLSGVQGCVTKVGATYYMYAQAQGSIGSGNQLVYTSPDGINWTQQSPSQVLTMANAGSWIAEGFYPMTGVVVVNGTWYGYYLGANSQGVFSTGYATSTDGINWVAQSTAAPLISGVLRGGTPTFLNGFWYMWVSASQPGQGGTGLDPFEMVRYKSPDLLNWTADSHSLHNAQMYESLNANTGGVFWGGGVFDVGGKAYMWLNSSFGDAVGAPNVGQISLAIAPTTIENVVQFKEDATTQVAVDTFARSAGGLGPNWTTPTGASSLQIASSGIVEPSAINTTCIGIYTGANFSGSQYSEVTIKTLTGTQFDQYIIPIVLAQPGSLSFYGIQLTTATGTISSTSAFTIFKKVNGSNTLLIPVLPQSTPNNITLSVGDVIRFAVTNGSDGSLVFTVYQNGFQVLQAQDYSPAFTSGYPGVFQYATDAINESQISGWAGGNTSVLPPYPPVNPAIPATVIGFAPNWYEGQNNAGLRFYVAPGSINGVVYPGGLQKLNVTINKQTGLLNAPVTVYFWLNSAGQIQQGLSLPASGPGANVYPIAAVNAINVLTGTRPNGFSPQITQAPGIGAVIDLRPITQTNFSF